MSETKLTLESWARLYGITHLDVYPKLYKKELTLSEYYNAILSSSIKLKDQGKLDQLHKDLQIVMVRKIENYYKKIIERDHEEYRESRKRLAKSYTEARNDHGVDLEKIEEMFKNNVEYHEIKEKVWEMLEVLYN